ncbi:MAG: ATP-binding protein [Myxococcales bacterium]
MDSFSDGQRKVLEQVASGVPLPKVLHALAKLIEAQAPGMLCSILLVDEERGALHHAAAPSLPTQYTAAFDGAAIGAHAGSCGADADISEQLVVEEVATHRYWQAHRELALRHGLRARSSTPIFSAKRELLGAFASYYREPRQPSASGQSWVDVASPLAAIAIERDRSERALRTSRDRAQHLAQLYSASTAIEQALLASEQRLRVLNELGDAMRATSDPDRVLPVALELLGRYLGVSRCAYANIEADGDHYNVPHDFTNDCASMVGRYRLSDLNPLRERRPDPWVVGNVDGAGVHPAGAQRYRTLGVRAFICCSLYREGTRRAMMVVHDRVPRDWTPDEVALVQEFVERCWATIEQRGAEAKLRKSEALLSMASRAAKLGGWILELREPRVIWSDEVYAIHEVEVGTEPTLEEAINFYAPEYRGRVRDAVHECVTVGKPFDFEAQLLTAKGRSLWVRAVGYAERDATGAVSRILGAFQDIGERQKLQEQLRQSQKMEAIGQLAGGVAHDFNNLLSVILGYSVLTADSLAPGHKLRADLDEITRAAERASELTRQLLAFGRKQVLQPRVIDLNHTVTKLRNMLRRVLGEDVTLSIVARDDLGKALVDPGQVEQVLLNLVVNARDAMPNGGTITIETDNVVLDPAYAETHSGVAAGPYVALTVTDTGVGMDELTLARIFEPFYTTKEQGKGTGLGLSMVWGIAAQSGGHVSVESKPGKGAAFTIYFPRVDAPLDELPSAPEGAPSLRGMETILLVEDDESVRGLLRSILSRNGYQVVEAQNAGEAFLLCERHEGKLHLLLTDVVMPRMSGFELAERVAPLRPEMKVIYLSGHAEGAIGHHGLATPRLFVLEKPITPDALLHKVREVLDAK